jgi:hypothetical protein
MNNTRNEWSAHWIDETRTIFDVKMKDGNLKTFQKGTWFKLPGRNDKVIIDSIVAPYNNIEDKQMLLQKYGDNDELITKNIDLGPRGITYLPWRYDEKRFATMSYTMRGNERFLICYPVGMRHFGQHIDWDLLEITSPPDNIDKELVKEVLERTNGL